ncbi:MAG: hypothetical protein HKM98_11095 [Gammaproteobacteria bacterium]|nr:hypothetical protein [Gammaproteobacteria bacterium]
MVELTENQRGSVSNRLRIAAWATAGLILLLPLIAMQFTDEVNWSAADFIVFGAMLAGVGIAFELAIRKSGNHAYRAGFGIGLAAVFLLIWVNLAVGIIGSETNDINMLYFGVIAVGIIGAIIATLKPSGMALTMFAMAGAQGLIAAIALIGGLGAPATGPFEILWLNGFWVALFIVSALLFKKAASERFEASD